MSRGGGRQGAEGAEGAVGASAASDDGQPTIAGLPELARASVRQARDRAAARERRQRAAVEPAAELPVARVLVDTGLAHLDRPFDYLVPAALDDTAHPGVRVKVRFAGQDVDGFVLERRAVSDHDGVLAPVRRVVSAEPVLTAQIAGLAVDLAQRYAGISGDVLRLAIPPRHATTEREDARPLVTPTIVAPGAGAWAPYRSAESFWGHLASGGAPRAVVSVLPGDDAARLVAEAAVRTAAAGRGVVACVPDRRDLDRLVAALTQLAGEGAFATLTADLGPARRYREFLAVLRGSVRIAIGTRAAAFAPVHDLGLVIIWDDGDDLFAEPRAPYPHTREVLLTRAAREDAGALVLGHARSVEAHQLVRAGWAHQVAAERDVLRQRVTVRAAGASEHELRRDPLARTSRMPREVHELIRDALMSGPVLVQTPRSGYALRLACESCRTPADCRACRGPLRLSDPQRPPACGWCGTEHPAWACAACGGRGMRSGVVGDARTGEELGRTHPSTSVITSSGDRVRAAVPATPAIVVATPGAEPVADGGYAAVVLLDAWLALGRDGLRSDEEALRRWSNAVGLVRPGGRALIVGDPAHAAVQALVRWDHAGFADREIEERRAAHLPPAARIATLTGSPGALDDALRLLTPPEPCDVLGPMPVPGGSPAVTATFAPGPAVAGDDVVERVVLRVPRAQGAALGAALGELQRIRSARKLEPVRVQVDPADL
ncbi:primosomal protein N' [Nocardioides sp. R-C-SC26]|uniref:primosomal protein N' n=1 Tax=Nocardioides sp. R-C-SC26 TaxID=2870414 RepID=UPI001E2AB5F8|nr:primosomal protein N' [Nocardioides sp. R-C-SC26]